MPFEPATFDAAYMMHVGMNIPDKDTLFAEIRRVLKPGGMFAVFDVMLTGRGELRFPLPCATTPDLAFFATAAEYRRAIEAAGFAVVCERDRREQACSFFRRLRARLASTCCCATIRTRSSGTSLPCSRAQPWLRRR